MTGFGDKIDYLITLAIGFIAVLFALKPGLFIKKEESIEKLKRRKVFLLICGLILIMTTIFRYILSLS